MGFTPGCSFYAPQSCLLGDWAPRALWAVHPDTDSSDAEKHHLPSLLCSSHRLVLRGDSQAPVCPATVSEPTAQNSFAKQMTGPIFFFLYLPICGKWVFLFSLEKWWLFFFDLVFPENHSHLKLLLEQQVSTENIYLFFVGNLSVLGENRCFIKI